MKFKNSLIRIIISFLLLVLLHVVPINKISLFDGLGSDNAMLILYLVAYLIIGGDIVKKAVSNLLHGEIFDENFLMTLATVGAFFIGEYPEAVAVMLFYQVGEMFQSYAVNKSRRSITSLMDIRPDFAFVKRDDGNIVKVNPEEIRKGQTIVVKPGEKVALDGKLAKGAGSLDVRALTGESLPREITEGDSVISGSISINGLLEIVVEKEFTESTVSKILDLVENSGNKKAQTEKFITKFARYYTPCVVAAAVLIGIIPPLIIGGNVWYDWIYRALTFLVISCPCALVISVPLSFFGGIGGASRKGVLVKGSNYLESLSKCRTVVFDKTGTLTKGVFKVIKINAHGIEEEELLKIAALAEYNSNHPISVSIIEELKNRNAEEIALIKDALANAGVEEIAGYGIRVVLDKDGIEKDVLAGNKKLMEKYNIQIDQVVDSGSVVYIAQNGTYLGSIEVADEIKEDAAAGISLLKKEQVKDIVMLTGDLRTIAEKIADKLGINKVFAELLPTDKVDRFEEILKVTNSTNNTVAFVGDGINDAPVLARADIGIAMGGLGSDAAIEAADIVIMDDEISGIAKAIRISKKTIRIVKENIVFALGVKGIVLILAAFGIASMWPAIFADVGVSVIAILNALRALK